MLRGIIVTGLVEGVVAQPPLTQKFADWVQNHTKAYATEADKALAFENFVKNDEAYTAHNAGEWSWTMGHNQFSDLSLEQFSQLYLGGKAERGEDIEKFVDYSLLNTFAERSSIDWVSRGAVTGVKNQGSCGSCWTFATTGAVEGHYQIASGTLLSLSEQQIVSCASSGDGCGGGWPGRTFKWVETHPLCLESEYSYRGRAGTCYRCNGKVKTGGAQYVPAYNEQALYTALQKGPVAVLVEADKRAFNGYNGGVLNSNACGTTIDHAVLLVAYGSSGSTHYWKIKNSWGSRWGEGGYIRVVYGRNMCGIGHQPSYPTGVTGTGPTPPSPTPPSPTPPSPTPPSPTPPSPTPGCHGTCHWNSDCTGDEKCWLHLGKDYGCCSTTPPSESIVV